MKTKILDAPYVRFSLFTFFVFFGIYLSLPERGFCQGLPFLPVLLLAGHGMYRPFASKTALVVGFSAFLMWYAFEDVTKIAIGVAVIVGIALLCNAAVALWRKGRRPFAYAAGVLAFVIFFAFCGNPVSHIIARAGLADTVASYDVIHTRYDPFARRYVTDVGFADRGRDVVASCYKTDDGIVNGVHLYHRDRLMHEVRGELLDVWMEALPDENYTTRQGAFAESGEVLSASSNADDCRQRMSFDVALERCQSSEHFVSRVELFCRALTDADFTCDTVVFYGITQNRFAYRYVFSPKASQFDVASHVEEIPVGAQVVFAPTAENIDWHYQN